MTTQTFAGLTGSMEGKLNGGLAPVFPHLAHPGRSAQLLASTRPQRRDAG
jgi:hypothetical protein